MQARSVNDLSGNGAGVFQVVGPFGPDDVVELIDWHFACDPAQALNIGAGWVRGGKPPATQAAFDASRFVADTANGQVQVLPGLIGGPSMGHLTMFVEVPGGEFQWLILFANSGAQFSVATSTKIRRGRRGEGGDRGF